MDSGLLDRFDGYIKDHAYTNRSEAIRDLIRNALVREEWDHDRETVGAITIVYDHHVPDLAAKLTHLQHSFGGEVVASMHVHLDHHNCMEVIVARGQASDLKKLSDRIIATRGVVHGSLTGSTTADQWKGGKGHHHHQGEHSHHK